MKLIHWKILIEQGITWREVMVIYAILTCTRRWVNIFIFLSLRLPIILLDVQIVVEWYYWWYICQLNKVYCQFIKLLFCSDLSSNCEDYAIKSLCYAALPLCNENEPEPAPRQLCREECEILVSMVYCYYNWKPYKSANLM